MSPSLPAAPKVLRLLCIAHGEWWEFMVGPGWLPDRLKSCLDEHLSTGLLLVDFEYLKDRLASKQLAIKIGEGQAGVRTLQAEGDAAGIMAMWLTSAMASSALPPLQK